MKVILVATLLAVAACEGEKHYMYGGAMTRGGEKRHTFGAMYIKDNMAFIGGMSMNSSHIHCGFELSGKFSKIEYKEDKSFVINATLSAGKWMNISFPATGYMSIVGTWENATVVVIAMDTKRKMEYTLHVKASKSVCGYNTMAEAAVRASYVLDEGTNVYHAADVLNHAVWGYAYIQKFSCKYYKDSFGTKIDATKPGAIIVGKDGKHCAIVDKEGSKLIQSHPSKDKVMQVPITAGTLRVYFPKGYIIKEYACKARLD